MPRINVLDKAVAELIAAGEVVERPASIVKELLENSFDAGATDITVEIRDGGVSFIRVTDNGCGIEREDIPRAFMRHATSKVLTADDLDGILTLGFRGEALASIAAVGKVELTTKTAADSEGTTYIVEGGEFIDELPAARPTGTTITVRDIFFNTPARMKFLKKDTGEGNAVAQVVDKCALSRPDTAFRFIRDGQVKLSTSGNGGLLAAIRAVYGAELAEGMMPVDYMLDGETKISGYVSKPGASRASRAYQNFFINGRYVRSRTCSAALEEACKGKIMVGKYPACVLNLEIMAGSVDVNVHPAKIEVRFVNEKPVFSTVYYAVKTALQGLETPLSRRESGNGAGSGFESGKITAKEYIGIFASGAAGYKGAGADKSGSFRSPLRMNAARIDIFTDEIAAPAYRPALTREAAVSDKKIAAAERTIPDIKAANTKTDAEPAKVPADAAEADESGQYRLIGELMNTYILLDGGDCMLLVDKHAAHERLIYERMMENISYGSRQVLLTPLTLTFSREEHGTLAENLDRLEEMGFLAEDFGGAMLVREIPIELGDADVAQAVGEIAAKLASGARDLTPEALDRLYYSIACKSALRAGDKSAAAELDEIIRRLAENPQITHCPHGRPVSVKISGNEISKMFGRLG